MLVLDKRFRVRFLESALLRWVSRRQTAVELGPRTKFVVFFSVAIGSPPRAGVAPGAANMTVARMHDPVQSESAR